MRQRNHYPGSLGRNPLYFKDRDLRVAFARDLYGRRGLGGEWLLDAAESAKQAGSGPFDRGKGEVQCRWWLRV